MARFTFPALLLLGSLFAVSAQADPLSDLCEDAVSAEVQARQLFTEIRMNFYRSPGYHAMSREVTELYQLAIQLRRATRHGDPGQIDSLIHRMDDLTVHLTQDIRQASRMVVPHHGHFHGAVNTHRAAAIADNLHDTLHHMDEHIDELQQVSFRPVQPVYRPQPNPGFSFGGQNFQIRFGR